jgi:hypothetical protein
MSDENSLPRDERSCGWNDTLVRNLHSISASPFRKGTRIEVRGLHAGCGDEPSPYPIPLKGRGDGDTTLLFTFMPST